MAPASMEPADVTLVPLRCVACHAPLSAREFQVFFLCDHCGAGQILEGEEMVSQEIVFAEGEGDLFLPFWSLSAQVKLTTQLLEREVRPVQFSEALAEILAQEPGLIKRVMQAYSTRMVDLKIGETQELSLYVPAFEATNFANYTANLGVVFTSAQPELKAGKPGRLVPVIYEREDAEKLAEIILVAVEAGRHDEVVDLGFEIKILEAKLLGIPFARDGDLLRDSLVGAKILAVGVVGLEEVLSL
jgi:predicted RNA-binding Zn-ribbon protein involved in translation (DUF1610 family)